jgi:two-component system response regulator ChvI
MSASPLTQYKVVTLIVAAAGAAVSYRTIYDEMYHQGFISGFGARGYEVNVRGTVKRIRRKFLALDPGFDRLGNRSGTGYYWAGAQRDGRAALPASDDRDDALDDAVA